MAEWSGRGRPALARPAPPGNNKTTWCYLGAQVPLGAACSWDISGTQPSYARAQGETRTAGCCGKMFMAHWRRPALAQVVDHSCTRRRHRWSQRLPPSARNRKVSSPIVGAWIRLEVLADHLVNFGTLG